MTDIARAELARLLQRWQDFGGTWTVIARTEHGATVALRRCDGGDEQDRFTCADPGFLVWLENRSDTKDSYPDASTPRRR